MKFDWMRFRSERWLTDTGLAACSWSSRGIWIALLCLMNRDAERGHLTIAGSAMPETVIARAIGADTRTLRGALLELEKYGVADRDGRGALRSNLMIRDEIERAQQAAYGRLGGNPLLTGQRPRPNTPASGPRQDCGSGQNDFNNMRANGVKAPLPPPEPAIRAALEPSAVTLGGTVATPQTCRPAVSELNGLPDAGLNPADQATRPCGADALQTCNQEPRPINGMLPDRIKAPHAEAPLTGAPGPLLQDCTAVPSDFSMLPQAGVNPVADLQLTSMFAARTLQECKAVLSEIKALLAESLKLSLIPRIREESKKERKEERVFVDATDFGAAPAEQQTPARAAADPVAHSLEAPLAPSASPLAGDTVAAPPAAATDATQAPLPLHRTDPTPQPAQAPSAEARSRTDRGVRLPPDWAPTADHIARARQHGFGPAQVATIAENFRDYWIAKPGAAGRKCDWDATFRVWLNREAERGSRRHVHQQKPKPGDWLLNRFYGDSDPGAETNAEPFLDVAAYAEDIR